MEENNVNITAPASENAQAAPAKKAFKRVNKKKVHAHSFRHLFAQVFLNEFSDNITELADILGHNSLETTRLYTRSSDSEKKSKLERLSFK